MATPPINAALAVMFPHDVVVDTYASEDREGARSYGSSATRKAYVYGEIKQHPSVGPNTIVSSVTAIFNGSWGLTPLDRYTLPAEFAVAVAAGTALERRQRECVYVESFSDENGAHTQVAYFK